MFHAMDRDRRRVFTCALAVGVLVLGCPGAGVWAAGVALDADFEAPAYTLTGGTLGGGVLQGQSGWLWDGTGLDPNVHSTAVVQDSIVKTGSQAVLVTRRPNSNRHWAMPKSGLPTQRFIAIDWDMRVAEAPTSTGLGPFFGLHTYDRTLGSPPKVLGTLGVDATTGEILTQQAQTGFFASTEATVLFDEWNHYRLVLDFSTDSFLGFVNGEHVISSPFVDDNPTQDLNTFSDADLWTVAGAADAASQALTGTAAFDNFVIRDGLLGDYDIDGDVDNGDYLRWRATFGQSVTAGHNADGNKNGMVDAADYVIWREHLGDSLFTNGLGAGLSSAVVPEPGSLVLGALALSVIAFTTGSRRR